MLLTGGIWSESNMLLCVIVKTCSDICFTIRQKTVRTSLGYYNLTYLNVTPESCILGAHC